MSELDDRLQGLRDELAAAIALPDVDRLTDRARTRRKVQVGAIAAVVAVVMAVPLARALPIWTAAGPNPAKTAYLVDFADADHGYALTRTCARGTVDCRFALYRTANGGADWQPRKLPRAPGDGFWDVMYVLGPDAVTLANPLGVETSRIFSTDGGRTWGVTEELTPAGTAPLPSHGVLTGGCGAQPYPGQGCGAVGSIQPDSGRFLAAPRQPGIIALQVGPAPTASGKWWVAGAVDGNPHAFLAVSADGGRTWSTSEMDQFAGPGGWSVVEHGNVMYATARSRSDRVFGVWRSTDGGRSWTRTWNPAAAEVLASDDGRPSSWDGPELLGSPVLTADGDLVLPGTTGTYVSADDGRDFTRTTGSTGWVTWTRAGYLRTQGHSFALSGDGSHWREFTVG
jgi:photosystem II stability/assembly factor-like uncharacterized protein